MDNTVAARRSQPGAPGPHLDDTLDGIAELYAHDEISALEMEQRIDQLLDRDPHATRAERE